MRRLDRYLISNIIKLLLISEFAGIVIFTLIEFFEHLDLFTESFSKFAFGVSYIALRVPYYFNLILPLAFLIAILILIIVMIRGNEIIAVRTAGVSTFSLMKPLVLFLPCPGRPLLFSYPSGSYLSPRPRVSTYTGYG